MKAILEFADVYAGYNKTNILNGLTFTVEEGQVCGIIGPNGCGKTTMLNALTGLIKPRAGKILFDGVDITGFSPDRRCKMGIGRTFQVPRPFENMSVYENVLVSAIHGAGLKGSDARETVLQSLKSAALTDKMDRRAGELALLDRKKLEIARALGTRPKLLLFDEVAAGLTEQEVQEVMGLVDLLKSRGYSIVWIEHIMETMVSSTDRLICMDQGRVAVSGDPKDVIADKEVETLYLGMDEDE